MVGARLNQAAEISVDALQKQVIPGKVIEIANSAIVRNPGNETETTNFKVKVALDDIPRFARLGVIAAMQPYHAIDDGRWAEKRIGATRIKTTYAFRTFLDHGVRLALGTD